MTLKVQRGPLGLFVDRPYPLVVVGVTAANKWSWALPPESGGLGAGCLWTARAGRESVAGLSKMSVFNFQCLDQDLICEFNIRLT